MAKPGYKLGFGMAFPGPDLLSPRNGQGTFNQILELLNVYF